jgi:hypothetical protein
MQTWIIFFHHENQACPSAFSDVGSLCLGTKNNLLTSFYEISDARLRRPITISIVLDGAAIEHADSEISCMQELQRICTINLSFLCVYNISIFITSRPDVRHLVQEQRMEKECADTWSQKDICPDTCRIFSKYMYTNETRFKFVRSSSPMVWRSEQCFKRGHDPKIAYTHG